MINAGLTINGFDGQQVFDYSVEMWMGIGVKVNYPEGQNASSNPIMEGDIIIEQNGSAWLVEQSDIDDVMGDTFRVALTSLTGDTTEDQMPSFGETLTGAVTTPKNGFVTVHWSPSLVSQEAARMASILTADLIKFPEPPTSLPDDVWTGVVKLS